jgi:hypothetical protein
MLGSAGMKQTNYNESPIRRVGPFARLSKIWHILFVSLVIDGLLAFYPISLIPPDRAQMIAALCCIFTIPFLNQESLSRLLSQARKTSNKNRDSNKANQNKFLVGAIVGALILTKLLLLPKLSGLFSLIFTAALVVCILMSAKHFIAETKAHSAKLKSSPWLYIQFWERQIVTIYCLPLIAARTVSTCGALSANAPGNLFNAVAYPIASVILLLALKPKRSTFIGWCQRCKTPTPIAFVEYGSCPSCEESLTS